MKKRKQAVVAFMLLCLIAAVAIAGTTALISRRTENRAGKDDGTEHGSQVAANDNKKPAEDKSDEYSEVNATGQTEENTEKQEETTKSSADAQTEGEDKTQAVAGQGKPARELLADKIAALHFAVGDILIWPVEGQICLEYNMEHTIYFPTLDLYRTNPGVCIQQDAGKDVLAGVEGIVVEQTNNAVYGNMVTVALGGGYEVTYGQLGEVSVKVGDSVEKNTKIGTVGEPTIFYSTEGSHLFLKLEKDGNPVDPLDFLNYS